MTWTTATSTTAKQRLAGLLLLFGTGVVGTLSYALIAGSDKPTATPVTQTPPTGTGTVIGGSPSSSPSSSPTEAPETPETPTGTSGTPGATPAPGTTAGPGTPGVDPVDPAVPVTGVFFIAGSIDGLVPGTAKTMPITVTNPNPWPIHVLTVDTTVTVPASPACPADSVQVADYAFAEGDPVITAPANGTARVHVPVELVDSLTVDQTACQGATFALAFGGTARVSS